MSSLTSDGKARDAAAELERANEVLRANALELEAQAEELQVTTQELEERTELALANEARYRFLADAIPVQVWTATPDGALDYVNEGATRYFQRTEQEILGAGWLGVLHPDDVARAVERWTQSLSTGEPYMIEFRLHNPADGDYRWHLVRAVPQRDAHGQIIKWFGTNTDIEDNKRTERELTRLHGEATAADRAKSDFLAAMSHELRTPLNAIGGYTQLLEMEVRGPVTDAQRLDLQRIARSQQHLLSLINDVLNFAKLGAGKVELQREPIPLARMLETVVEMVSPQLQEKGLTLTLPSCDSTLAICADTDRVRQILLNLLGNALKFTEPGGQITLTCTPGDDQIAMAVQDTGVGIPADKLDSIFEPFVQVGRRLSTQSGGIGLGLTISRELARAMGGNITVESQLHLGSTFTLSLPAV